VRTYNTGDQNRLLIPQQNTELVGIDAVTAFMKDQSTCPTTLGAFELEKLEWGSHRAGCEHSR
jgi:hypothetical protein